MHCLALSITVALSYWGPYDSYTTCVLRTAEMKYEAKVIFKDRKFPYKPKSGGVTLKKAFRFDWSVDVLKGFSKWM